MIPHTAAVQRAAKDVHDNNTSWPRKQLLVGTETKGTHLGNRGDLFFYPLQQAVHHGRSSVQVMRLLCNQQSTFLIKISLEDKRTHVACASTRKRLTTSRQPPETSSHCATGAHPTESINAAAPQDSRYSRPQHASAEGRPQSHFGDASLTA